MPRFTGQLAPVVTSYDHVIAQTEANRASTAAARAAATEQWERERGAAPRT